MVNVITAITKKVKRSTTKITIRSDNDLRKQPKAFLAAGGTGQTKLLDKVRRRQPALGYVTATHSEPDVDRARDPYRARELARSSAERWKENLAKATPPDVNVTNVIVQFGGTGAIAQAASPIPLDVTGHDIVNFNISTHKTHSVGKKPAPEEAINQVLAYQAMDRREGQFLFANDVLTHGKEGIYDKFADFLATIGLMDTGRYRNGGGWTGGMKTIDAGNNIDPLREEIRDRIWGLHEEPGPWWATEDFVWWEDVESPLLDQNNSSVLIVYPARFRNVMTDVEARDLPYVDQTEFAPIDSARVIVLRRLDTEFVRDTLKEGSKQWLIDEINDPESVYGQTWRDFVYRHRRTADPVVALEDLTNDLQRRR